VSPILGIWASQNYPRITNSYESIQTVTVGSGGQAAIDFTSIPSTYKHLQIRGISRSTAAQNYFGMRMQVGNGSVDTGSNYSVHELYGDGSTVTSSANSPQSTTFIATSLAANDLANTFGGAIIDLLEYGNTNIHKTFRCLSGADKNGAGLLFFNSAGWRSTSAINTIKLYPSGGNFAQYSQFALYGIKG
jgi:hypothetical protein